MTTPLAATSNAYRVTFDGDTIHVFAKRGKRPLRTIPLPALASVEFHPASDRAKGLLVFHIARGKPVRWDRIPFTAQQQPAMEYLAGAIDHHQRTSLASDPWAGHPVAPNQTIVNSPLSAGTQRMLYRTLTLGMWLEGAQLLLLLIPVALTLVCCGAFIFSR